MRDHDLHPLLAQTRFLQSAPRRALCPPEQGPEVGFSGRSNAGKSSALNTLTGQKGLARVSKTPGRTQLINYFEVPSTGGYLVDLPGYGYAKVPEAMKREWQQNLGEFLENRRTLVALVVLMDVRLPLTDLDQQLLEFSDHRGMHSLLLLTKSDKVSKNEAARARFAVQKARPQSTVMNFSSLTRIGLTEASDWIAAHLAPATDSLTAEFQT